MKFKACFLLAMTLIVLFSIGTIAASENIEDLDEQSYGESEDLSLSEVDSSLSDDYEDSGDESNNDVHEDSADLAEDAQGDSAGDVQEESKSSYNEWTPNDSYKESRDANVSIRFKTNNTHPKEWDLIRWTFVVRNNGEIAYDTKVFLDISGVKYLGHNVTLGRYSFKKGIWNIGTFKSSKKAILTIDIMAISYNVDVFAIVSVESEHLGNPDSYCIQHIDVQPPPAGPVSESSDQPKHSRHYASSRSGMITRVVETSADEGSRETSDDKNLTKNDTAKNDSNDDDMIIKEENEYMDMENIRNNSPYYGMAALAIIGIIAGIVYKKR